MQGLSVGTELISFAKDPDSSEWYVAQLAVGGNLCVPFSVQAHEIGKLANEAQLMAYLERQAVTMISTYGDARNPNQAAFSEYMEA